MRPDGKLKPTATASTATTATAAKQAAIVAVVLVSSVEGRVWIMGSTERGEHDKREGVTFSMPM